jgi:PAS domain-containing protein
MLASCIRLLHERTILVLTILFCVGVVCMLWYVSHLQSNLIASTALMAVMSVLWLSGLALAIGRLRQSSADLTQRASALENEISERQGLEQALRESEERYRHTINAAADAIISIDEAGLVCEFNRAAEQIFGFSKTELMGQPLTAVIPERLRHQHV